MHFLQAQFWTDIENWPISFEIGVSWMFPLLESIHVIAAAMVLGSIFMVDLRLIGVAAIRYPISVLSRDLVPLSWLAFIVACITGLGMFITRAATQVLNPAFQWKIIFLVLAGVNMACFHFMICKSISSWDDAFNPPRKVKVTGAVSLCLWIGVMLAGRWVGHLS